MQVGNFIGRIVVGWASDHYRHKLHRVFWMMLSCIGMCFTHLFIFFIGTNIILFFIAAICIGFSYGWIFSVVITSCSDLWGTKYLSGNYAAFDSAPAIGQLIFSNLIFAQLYQSQHKAIKDDDTKCYGSDCYKWTFLICSASCIIAFLMTMTLWVIVRRKKDKLKKINANLDDNNQIDSKIVESNSKY